MNKTMVIGLSVLLCLYLAFGLVGCAKADETRVMYPVFYQLVQGYSGMAGPPDKTYGPVSFMRKEDCLDAIAARPNPENYYCLRYESAKTIDYTFPSEAPGGQ